MCVCVYNFYAIIKHIPGLLSYSLSVLVTF